MTVTVPLFGTFVTHVFTFWPFIFTSQTAQEPIRQLNAIRTPARYAASDSLLPPSISTDLPDGWN